MPKRRALRNALAAGIAGFGQTLASGLERNRVQQETQRREGVISRRQLDLDILNRDQALQDRVAKGEITPEQAVAMAEANRRTSGSPSPPPDFASAVPSPEARLGPIRRGIGSATSAAMVPSQEEIVADAGGLGVKDTVPPIPGPGADIAHVPAINDALAIRRRRLEGFDTQRQQGLSDDIAKARGTAYASAIGNEAAAAETADAGLARKAKEAQTLGDVDTGVQVARQGAMIPGKVKEAVDTQRGVGPLRTAEAVNTAVGTAAAAGPIQAQNQVDAATATHRGNLLTDKELGAGDFKDPNLKPATADEKKAFNYATGMTQAQEVLRKVEPKIAARGFIPNLVMLNTPEQISDNETRAYYQALRSFINGVKRRESGAAVTQQEVTEYMQMFGYVAGDPPELQQQKLTSRRNAIVRMAGEATPGMAKLFITTDELHQAAIARGITDAEALKQARKLGAQVIY